MVRTPFTAMSVCLLTEGGEENGGCCCYASLLIVPEVPNVWYEIGAACVACAAAGNLAGRSWT
jgi:hypothetical protein